MPKDTQSFSHWKTIPEFPNYEAHRPTTRNPYGIFRRKGQEIPLRLIPKGQERSPIVYIYWSDGRSTNRTTKSLLGQTFDPPKPKKEEEIIKIKYTSVESVARSIWKELKIYPYDNE